MVRLTERQSWTLVLTLALLIVAGFESSTFVGGITFAIAALLAAPIVFTAVNPARRRRLLAALALAALLVVCLIAPFVLNQWAAVRARGGGTPITVSHYRVFGEFLPLAFRRMLDLPGYWLVILPVELPAIFFAGVIALIAMLRSALPRAEKLTVALLACLAGAGLMVSWLLVSTLGDNNDLGLRAIIPAEMVLIVSVAAAAAGLAKGRLRIVVIAIALTGLALSLPDTAKIIRDNVAGRQRPGGLAFAQSPELWAAVRRYAPPGRAHRQQSAIRERADAVAGEHIVGVARQPKLMLCRSRFSARLYLAAAGAPRDDQRAVRSGVCRRGHRRRRARHGDAIWL